VDRNEQEPLVYSIDVTIDNDHTGDQTTGMQWTNTEAWYLHDAVVQLGVDAGAPQMSIALLNVGGVVVRTLAVDNPAVNGILDIVQKLISEQTTNVENTVGAPTIPILIPAGYSIRIRVNILDAAGFLRIWLYGECVSRPPTQVVIGAVTTVTINEGDAIV